MRKGQCRGSLLRRGDHRRRLIGCVSVLALSVSQVLPAFAEVLAQDSGPLQTATSISTTGSVTDITTGTITGGVAYNSFKKFEVETNTTVNLFQPSASTALVNVVNNAAGTPSRVDGTLNTLKEGGGESNVFILDHNGFVVGAGGVINAHKLSLSTAAQAVGAEILREGLGLALTGADTSPTDSHFKGLDTLSAADIDVQGEINATGLALRAGARMILDGAITVDAPTDEGTGVPIAINILGKPEVDQVKVEGGAIRFFAGGDAQVSDTLRARRGDTGGQISGWVEGNLTIAAAGTLDVDGAGAENAGSILMTVQGSAAIAPASTLTAKAVSGDGGIIFAESLLDNDTLSLSGTFDASSQSDAARTGGVYFLADIIEIVDDISSNGADLVIEGLDTVRVTNGATISTRRIASGTPESGTSTGTSGDLVLTAPEIALQAGSSLFAQGDDGFEGGLITLLARDATRESLWTFSKENRAARVTVDQSTLHGGAVVINAFAQSTNFISLDFSEEAAIVEAAVDQTVTDINTSGNEIVALIDNAADLVGDLLVAQAPVLNTLIPLQVFTMKAEAEVTITDSTITADGNWKGRGAALPAMNRFYNAVPTTSGLITAPNGPETEALAGLLPDIPDEIDLTVIDEVPIVIDLTAIKPDYSDPDNYFELPDFAPFDPFFTTDDSGQFTNSISTIPSGLVEGILSVFDPALMDMRLVLPYTLDTTNDSIFVQSHAHTDTFILPPLAFGLGFSYTSTEVDSRTTILNSDLITTAGDIELNSTALDSAFITMITPKVPGLSKLGAPDFAIGAIVGFHDIENQLLVDGGTTSAGANITAQARSAKSRTQNLTTNAGQNGAVSVALSLDIGNAFTEAALGGDVLTGTNVATPGDLLLAAETLHWGKDHTVTATLGIANLAFAALKKGLTGPLDTALQAAPQSIKSIFASGEEGLEDDPDNVNRFAFGSAIDIAIERDDTFATLGGRYHDFDNAKTLVDLAVTNVTADGKVDVNADLRFARPQEGGTRLNRLTAARMGKLNLGLQAQLEVFNAGLIGSGAEPLTREEYLGEFGNALFVTASVGLMSGETQAELGGNANIVNATDITVAANTIYPTIDVFGELVDDFRTFFDEASALTQVDGDLDDIAPPDESPKLPNIVEYLNPFNYLTTFVQTRAEQPADKDTITAGEAEPASQQQSVAIAISGNYFQTENTTKAVVREGARISDTDTNSLTVEAEQRALFIHMANKPTVLKSGVKDNSNVNNAIGGFFNMQRLISNVEAVIEGGTDLTADTINVDARTELYNFDVVFAGGSAASLGVNGAFAITATESSTIARVDDDAKLTATNVMIRAEDDSLIYATAGTVSGASSGATSVGASISLNFLTREVYAGVGPAAEGETLDAEATKVVIDADTLTIEARNDALDISTGIAGAFVSGKPADEATGPAEDQSKDNDSVIPTFFLKNSEKQKLDTQKQVTTQPASDGAQQQTGWAIAGAASLNLILDNQLTAELATAGRIELGGALSVRSVSTNLGIAGTGASSVGKSKIDNTNALAGAFSVIVDDRDLETVIREATISAGSVVFAASDEADAIGVAVGGAGSASGKVTLAGSVAVNVLTGTTETRVENVDLSSIAGTTITSRDESFAVAIGGALSVNLSKTEGAGVGIGIGVNVVTRSTRTQVIGATTLSDAGAIMIGADMSSSLYAFGVSVGVGKTGVAGAIASSDIFGGAETTVGQASGARVQIEAGSLNVTADEDYEAWSLAGALTGGQKTAVGGALTVNLVDAKATADVLRTDVTARDASSTLGDVDVAATSDSLIATLAVAGGASKDAGIGVGLSTNNISSTTHAGFAQSTATDAASFDALATNTRQIKALTGGVAAAGRGGAGFGLSVNLLTGNETTVDLTGATVTTNTGALTGRATSSASIQALSVGISASKNLSIGGGATVNGTGATTQVLADDATLTAQTELTLDATDSSTIESLAGGAALSLGGSGVGAALAVNVIDHDTVLSADGATLTARTAAMGLSANNDATIRSLSAGLAVSGGGAAIGGAISIGYIGNSNTVSVLDTAMSAGEVDARQNIAVAATKSSTIEILSGSAAVGSNAFGGAVTVAVIADTVSVDVSVDRAIAAAEFAATAENASAIDAIAVAGAASSGVSFAGSLVYAQIGKPGANAATLQTPDSPDANDADAAGEGEASARDERDAAFQATTDRTGQTFDFDLDQDDLTRARVDLGAGTAEVDALRVTATETGAIRSLAGAISGGASGGFGAGIGLNLLFGGTEALLVAPEEQRTELDGNITVSAAQIGSIETLGAAGAVGGSVGGAGSILLNIIDRSLLAVVTAAPDDGDAEETVLALNGGSLTVAASQEAQISALAGAASFGGSGGIGGAIVINALSDDSAAILSNLEVDARAPAAPTSRPQFGAGTVSITAQNTSNLENLAVAAAGGGSGAFAGSFAINVADATVAAQMSRVTVRATDLTLRATGNNTLAAGAGNVSVGGGGAAGVGIVTNVSKLNILADMDGVRARLDGNAEIKAKAETRLPSFAISGAAGGGIAFSGSGVANTSENVVTARIRNSGAETTLLDVVDGGGAPIGFGGSDVIARGTVDLSAIGRSQATLGGGEDELPNAQLNFAGGGVAGIGASVGVNTSANQITAILTDDSRLVGLGLQGKSVETATGFRTVRGAYVGAQATSDVGQVSANGAVGINAAVVGLFNFNILEDAARVQIGDGTAAGASRINTTLLPETFATLDSGLTAPSSLQDTEIEAVARSDVESYAVGAAVSAGLSVGASSTTNIFDSTAKVDVLVSTISAEDDATISARTASTLDSYVIGLSGGFVGAAASVGVNLFSTEAQVSILASNVAAGLAENANADLSVTSDVDNTLNAFVGGLGAGAVGAAGGINVTTLDSVSRVTLGSLDVDGTTEVSRLISLGDTDVTANTNTFIDNYAVSGGVGAFAAAFSTNVTLVKSVTEVVLGTDQVIESDENTNLKALEVTDISGTAGSVSVGGTSFGASFDYANFAGRTQVRVGDRAQVGGGQSLVLEAKSTRTVDSEVLVGNVGLTGLSASLSIVELGALAEDDDGERAARLNDIQGLLGDDQSTDDGSGGGVESLAVYAGGDEGRKASVARRQAQTVNGAPAPDSIGVVIGSNVVLQAQNSVSVLSTAETGVNALSGAATGGGLIGGSLSATIAKVSTASEITLGNDVEIFADQSVTIGARTANAPGYNAVEGEAVALAGSFGFAGAAGLVLVDADADALVTIGQRLTISGAVDPDTIVNIGDGVGGEDLNVSTGGEIETDVVSIFATRGDTARADVVNLNVGGVGGVGATLATAKVTGRSEVNIGVGSSGAPSVINAGTLNVTAGDSTFARAQSEAASGGIGFAVSGTVSEATNQGRTDLRADRLEVNADQASFAAASSARSFADADGITIGGALSVGVSAATATTQVGVSTTLRDADIEATTVSIASRFSDANGVNAAAEANSASGGLLAGNGAEATAYLDYEVETRVSGRIIGFDDIIVASRATGVSARADAVGRAGGLAVVGLTKAYAGRKAGQISEVTTHVTSGTFAAVDELTILSENDPDLAIDVSSGTGGLVTGAGGEALSDFRALTQTRVGESGVTELSGFKVSIGAEQNGRYNSQLDNTAGALVGVSGATSNSTLRTDVDTVLGSGVRLVGNAFDISASNDVLRPFRNFNVKSGSGGVLDLPAMVSNVTVDASTDLDVASGAQIVQVGDRLQPGTFEMGIETSMTLNDRMFLDAGGAVAAPIGNSTVRVNSNASRVAIGNVDIFALGDIEIYNGGDADLLSEVDTVAYGLAGAPVSNSGATYVATNDIDILSGARIESLSNIFLNAGSISNRLQSVDVQAESRTFNKTAIPIPVTPDADAAAFTNSRISLAAGSEMLAVRDIFLQAEAGNRDVVGFGLGKDLYREAAEEVGNFFGGLVGADEISLDIESGTSFDNTTFRNPAGIGLFPNGVTVNGLVRAGSRNRQVLLLDFNDMLANENPTFNAGAAYTDEMAEEISWFVEKNVSVTADLQDRITELQSFLDNPNLTDSSGDVFTIVDGKSVLTASSDPARQAWISEQQSLVIRAASTAGQVTDKVVVGEILAVEGNIILRGDYVDGAASGQLIAPGDAEVTIEVNSGSMLEILSRNDYLRAALEAGVIDPADAIFGPEQESSAITIPSVDGGLVTFNDVLVTSAQDLQNRAFGRAGAYAFDVESGADSGDPQVVLKTIQPVANSRGTSSMNIAGDISNLRGRVTASSDGDIDLRGDISAKVIDVRAAGNMTVGFIPGIRDVAGDPIAQYADFFLSQQNSARNQTIVRNAQRLSQQILNTITNPDKPLPDKLAVDRTIGVNAFNLAQSSGGLRAGKNIYVSADKLNINGTIAAGIGTFEVTLLAGLEAELQALRDAGGSGQVILHDASFPIEKRRFTSPYILSDTNVRVIYDYDTDQVLLDDMVLQGGEVYITGDILSTGRGRIEALQGFGRVVVNSDIATTVVLDRIDLTAGSDTGISGLVRIIDTGRTVNDNGQTFNLITEYRRENGNVLVYNNDGNGGTNVEVRNFGDETIAIQTPALLVDTIAGRAAEYQTLERDLIVLTSEVTTRVVEEKREQLIVFGITGSSKVDKEEKSYRTTSNVTNPDILAPYLGPALGGPDYAYRIRATAEGYSVNTTSWEEYYDNVKWYTLGSGWRGDERTVTTVSRQNYEHRLKADYDVTVFFNGVEAADAGLSVVTKGDVIFGNAVVNETGMTDITSTVGSIFTANKNIALTLGTTSLTAASGSITGQEGALRLDMTPGATLSATALESIDIREMDGDLILSDVATTKRSTAQGLARPGDVTVMAQGSILAESGITDAVITGTDITLTAESGGIGASGAPVTLNSEGEGELIATAPGDINLAETIGDMRVNTIVSIDGGVSLSALNGSILDRNAVETKDVKTLEALQAFWKDELGLDQSEESSPRAQVQIAALEARNTQLNRLYWEERTANGGAPVSYTLDPALRADFQRGSEQPDGSFSGGWTDAMVAEYEARNSALYDLWNATQSSFDAGYAYEATQADKDGVLQEMGWSDAELTRRIQSGLVTERGDTNIRDEAANITAKGDITLRVRDRVGELLPDYVIASKPSFSDTDLEVLYGATRDDLTIDTDAGEIRVRQNEDLNFAFTADSGLPTGKLRVEATSSDIFMAAETPTAIADVDGTQAVEIRVDGLISDHADGDIALQGRVVVLESGEENSIGTVDVPLTVNILPGGSFRANSGENIFVDAPLSDLPLAGVFAGQTTRLRAAGAITDTVGTGVPRIVAGNVDLMGSSIGTGSVPLGIQIIDPKTGTVDLATTASDLFVSAFTDFRLNSVSVADGGLLQTTGDQVLRFVGVDTVAFGAGSFFGIDAGGGIDVTASSGTDLSGGTLALVSDGPVGTGAKPVTSALGTLSYATRTPGSTARDTSLWLREADALTVTTVVQNANSDSTTWISAGGDLTVGQITSQSTTWLISDANLTDARVVSERLEITTEGAIGSNSTIDATVGSVLGASTDGDVNLLLRDRDHRIDGLTAGGAGNLVLTGTNSTTTVANAGDGVRTDGGNATAVFDRLFLNETLSSATGQMDLTVLTDMTVDQGGSVVSENATRDALLATVTGTLEAANQSNPVFDVNTAGALATLRIGAIENTGPIGLRTRIAALDAEVYAGDIHLNDTDGLIAETVQAFGGNIDLFAQGDLEIGVLSAQGPAQRSVVAAAQGSVLSDLAVIEADEIRLFSFGGDIRGVTGRALEADTEAGAELWLLANRDLLYTESDGDMRLALGAAQTRDLEIDVANGAAVVGVLGARRDLTLSAETGVAVNTMGRTSIDIADESALALIDGAPTRFGTYLIDSPASATFIARAPGANLLMGLGNVRNEVSFFGDIIDANIYDVTPNNDLRLNIANATGDLASFVDVDSLAPGPRIETTDPFDVVLPKLENRRIADLRPENPALPVSTGTLIIGTARVGTGEITHAGPRVRALDMEIGGDVWIRQRSFDMLLQTEFDTLSTFADVQMLAVQVQPDGSTVAGVANFDLFGELILSTDTLIALNRRLDGVIINGNRGFVFGVGSELQVIANRFLAGGDVGPGAFDGTMPWVISPSVTNPGEDEIVLPMIMAQASP